MCLDLSGRRTLPGHSRTRAPQQQWRRRPFLLLAWYVRCTGSMTNYDTASRPLFYLDGIPVPTRTDDPARAALIDIQRALLDDGRWADADLVGWLLDDLDWLPLPWAQVVRLLLDQ